MQGIFAHYLAVATRTDTRRQPNALHPRWDAPRHWYEGSQAPRGRS